MRWRGRRRRIDNKELHSVVRVGRRRQGLCERVCGWSHRRVGGEQETQLIVYVYYTKSMCVCVCGCGWGENVAHHHKGMLNIILISL